MEKINTVNQKTQNADEKMLSVPLPHVQAEQLTQTQFMDAINSTSFIPIYSQVSKVV